MNRRRFLMTMVGGALALPMVGRSSLAMAQSGETTAIAGGAGSTGTVTTREGAPFAQITLDAFHPVWNDDQGEPNV